MTKVEPMEIENIENIQVYFPLDISIKIVNNFWKQVCPIYTVRDAYQDTCQFSQATGHSILSLLDKNEYDILKDVTKLKELIDDTKNYDYSDIYMYLGVHDSRIINLESKVGGDIYRKKVRDHFQGDHAKWLQYYLSLYRRKIDLANTDVIPTWFLRPLFPIFNKFVPTYSIINTYQCFKRFDEMFPDMNILEVYKFKMYGFLEKYKDQVLLNNVKCTDDNLLFKFVEESFEPKGYVARTFMKEYFTQYCQEIIGSQSVVSNIGLYLLQQITEYPISYHSNIMVRFQNCIDRLNMKWIDPNMRDMCINYILQGVDEIDNVLYDDDKCDIEAYKEKARAFKVYHHPNMQEMFHDLTSYNSIDSGISFDEYKELDRTLHFCVMENNFYKSCENLQLKPISFDFDLSVAFGLEDEVTKESSDYMDYICENVGKRQEYCYHEENIKEQRDRFNRLYHLRQAFDEYGFVPRTDSRTCNIFVLNGVYEGPVVPDEVLNNFELKYYCKDEKYQECIKKLLIIAQEMDFLFKNTYYFRMREMFSPPERTKLEIIHDLVKMNGEEKVKRSAIIPERLKYLYFEGHHTK